MRRIIRLLARGLGAASLATLLSSGSASVAAPVEEPTVASFQAPAKRLVLDYSPESIGGHADLQRSAQRRSHGSHFSHSSHHSHYSGR